MAYRYPRISNYLIIRKTGFGEYEVFDFESDKRLDFELELIHFAMRLDGRTDPYTVMPHLSREEVRAYLAELDKHNLLRRTRCIRAGPGGGLYFTLWAAMPGRTPFAPAPLFDRLLSILFLPFFIAGLWVFLRYTPELDTRGIIPSLLFGLLAGVALHELGHTAAALRCGRRVFEAGFMLRFTGIGAYVGTNSSPIDGLWDRVQFSAAGVEANLLLAGLSCLLAALPGCGFFFWAALVNTELAVSNLLLVSNLDGGCVMSALLGVDSLTRIARTYCRNLLRRVLGRRRVRPDAIYSAMCFSAALIQPTLLIYLVLNVWVLVLWI